jgi:hypothetical protein
MSRKGFDVLTSTGGLIGVVVLLVAGGLLTWGHSFVNTQVHNQLAQQQIHFPPKSAFRHPNGTEFTAAMAPYMEQYGGQQMLTGAQAEAYANHFIAIHLSEMPYHGVYSKVSAANLAAKPGSAQATKLSALETTVFQGTTLRGLLLEAYAFSKIGEVMLWGAIASFGLAALMLALVTLGFQHARSTAPEKRTATPKTKTAAIA